MFVLSHPWRSHPVRVHFTTLGPSARSAKSGVIRATTAYSSRFPVNKRCEKSIYGAHARARTFSSLYPSSIPQAPEISSLSAPPPHKVILGRLTVAPIFSQSVRERTICESLVRMGVLVKSNIKKAMHF